MEPTGSGFLESALYIALSGVIGGVFLFILLLFWRRKIYDDIIYSLEYLCWNALRWALLPALACAFIEIQYIEHPTFLLLLTSGFGLYLYLVSFFVPLFLSLDFIAFIVGNIEDWLVVRRKR